MPRLTATLESLFERHVAKLSTAEREQRAWFHADCSTTLRKLARRGVISLGDLLAQLSVLPSGLQISALHMLRLFEVRQAVPVLLELVERPRLRLTCASLLKWSTPDDVQVKRYFQDILQRELAADTPDVHWLEAVLQGLRFDDDSQVAGDILTIYERQDLPDWLRGDAADCLGGGWSDWDRRTTLFRRASAATHRGLFEDSLEVQFWTMYLIMQLATPNSLRSKRGLMAGQPDPEFADLLPQLRMIARHDHRLAPGFWWPMSAEAEDTISTTETGLCCEPDAGERWAGNPERGVWNRPKW